MKEEIKRHILAALEEDVQQGDYSTLASVKEGETKKVKLVAKQDGILCGIDVFCLVFDLLDKSHNIKITKYKKDGEELHKGDIILRMEGNARAILTGERTALNYMQLLSGIATTTKEYVSLIEGMHTKLLDTRKTTPGLRLLEKYAVKTGGGYNHRFGLFDMIMLKDNHIDFAGGIKQAIEQTNNYLKANNLDLKIEIEVRDFKELDEVLQIGGVDRIMLDNFSPMDLTKAIDIINGRYETEASGGINKDTLRTYAESGVDYISVGALTHHISALDISLVADDE
ncbi:MAG: carboxylating nicotinate-nucleotide diphosphorylase [Bacteroidales bacterium]|nr:carboxylating nicotinate-nucleotide diphosphorylase [Bacteroidales bacterium]MDY6394628.1 carboxylating nicotinate-nucleotide diphosphorylase [Bacteroidales bacterium]MDY6403139.1 carboxylating nicotinate-nucleotide diphosphorylase [Bacteroidales bacterium]MDY6423861.1 carboxylating nicotinate-nucleotide diphosphorylase [Bacteroidales bacterium]